MTRLLTALLFTVCAFSTQGMARGSSHEAGAENIYDPNEPHARLKGKVESLMGIYLVHPPRRHHSERIQIRKKTVKASVWHPVGEASDTELMTRAVKWLIFGRTQYASGARGVFSTFDKIDRITLVFHDVIRTRRSSRRRRSVREKVKDYLSLTIDRTQFERLNMTELRECVERLDCATVFAQRFTRKSVNQRFLRKSRQAK